jgi:hypothetical protein
MRRPALRSTQKWLVVHHQSLRRKPEMHVHPSNHRGFCHHLQLKETSDAFHNSKSFRNFEKITASNEIYSDIRYVLPLIQWCQLQWTTTHIRLEALICRDMYWNVTLKHVVCGTRYLTELAVNEFKCWSLVMNSKAPTGIAQKPVHVSRSGNSRRIHEALIRGSQDSIIWH